MNSFVIQLVRLCRKMLMSFNVLLCKSVERSLEICCSVAIQDIVSAKANLDPAETTTHFDVLMVH